MTRCFVDALVLLPRCFSGNPILYRSVRCASFSSHKSMQIFDRTAKLKQRERAAMLDENHVYDYLKDEVGYRLADRILDIKKELKVGLDLGCGKGLMAKHIMDSSIEHLNMVEFSPSMLKIAHAPENVSVTKTVMDEEKRLPFDDKSHDVVLSNLSLHWVNDLPGCLRDVNRILKNDGVFLASMFGCDTLYQLRSAFVLAELEREGGFASHVSPLTEIRDIGGLLTSSGFTTLTIDTDEITVGYPSLFELMRDLKGMAENNASYNRKLHLHRDTILAAAAIYQEMYGDTESIPATFHIIYMIGWKADPSMKNAAAVQGERVSFRDMEKLNELIKEHGMEGRVKFMHDLDRSDKPGDDKK